MYSKPSATEILSWSSAVKLNHSVATDTIVSSISTTSICTWSKTTQNESKFSYELNNNHLSVQRCSLYVHNISTQVQLHPSWSLQNKQQVQVRPLHWPLQILYDCQTAIQSHVTSAWAILLPITFYHTKSKKFLH